MRFFNTAGPVNPDLHYCLPVLERLDLPHILRLIAQQKYKEAGPQLLMQAFLQRVVNGSGRIEREYGLGRMRTALLVIWPHPGGVQRAVIELKILDRSLDETLRQGLAQLSEYLDRVGAAEGYLVIFDRGPDRSWEDGIFRREETPAGRRVRVWGM